MAAGSGTVGNFLQHPMFLHLEIVSKIFEAFVEDLTPMYDRIVIQRINPSTKQLQLEAELLQNVENNLFTQIAPAHEDGWFVDVNSEVVNLYKERYFDKAILNDKGYWMFRAIRNSIEHFGEQQNKSKYTAMYAAIGNFKCSFLVHIITHRKQLVPATTKFILENEPLLVESSKVLKETSLCLPKTIPAYFDDIIENCLDMVDNILTSGMCTVFCQEFYFTLSTTKVLDF